jgi:sarcosine oxidase delta subunit
MLGRYRYRCDNIKVALKEEWAGLIWLRKETSGMHLSAWQRIFGFYQMLGILS